MPRNIELKVPFTVTAARRSALASLGAVTVATLRQTDSYFVCPNGRLKLREIEEVTPSGTSRRLAELIAYQRPNVTGLRGSEYVVCPVQDPQTLLATLSAALGLRVVVRKRRELLLWHAVRIHLDTVEGLGDFLEFEAVVEPPAPGQPFEDEATSRQRLKTLSEVLHIDPADTIDRSYSDLLLDRHAAT